MQSDAVPSQTRLSSKTKDLTREHAQVKELHLNPPNHMYRQLVYPNILASCPRVYFLFKESPLTRDSKLTAASHAMPSKL